MKKKTFENILTIATNYPIFAIATLLPFFICLFVWFKKFPLNSPLKLILLFSFYHFVSDLPLWITSSMNINNQIYYYIRDYSLHTFILFIYLKLEESESKKKFIRRVIIFLILITLPVLPDLKKNHDLVIIFYKMGVISAVFIHFNTIIHQIKVRNLFNYPFFWISSGILLFTSGSILVALFGKYVLYNTSDVPLTRIFTQFVELLSISMFLLIGVGFIKTKKTISSYPS
ncbi:hypothetical protein GVN16_19670 [Emticicia sp. CRIBPO]|uniref:hypothetical protein n=1 Tax=Emticicia sp. CRIBPO TaxID=2683258 RepID=UPI0014137176|nr:hypothetical protein [Emticicia sp. CRIBPO]NBA87999.1 hypothetical protein [Emticicia sp. CRIBPO]